MFTIFFTTRRTCRCLASFIIGLLCLLCAGSSLSHAQDPEPTILKLQVLAWNQNVRDLAAQSMPEPVMLSATRGRVSFDLYGHDDESLDAVPQRCRGCRHAGCHGAI